MYLTKKTGDARFSLKTDGEIIKFFAENYDEPLRCYAVFGGTTVYAGLTEPYGNGFRLIYPSNENIERFLVLKGTLNEKHDVVCDFELSKNDNDFIKQIFSHPSACDSVNFYGHFLIFDIDETRVFAFPSDFEMHPLLHLLKYSFWYPFDFGYNHKGYYVTGVSRDGNPCFPDVSFLKETE